MAYHPHGDAPINEALSIWPIKDIYSINKETSAIYSPEILPLLHVILKHASLPLLKKRCSIQILRKLLPPMMDGIRNLFALPAKIPLVLMQGADGIAVGMATHILPHNFVELLEAEICYFGRS